MTSFERRRPTSFSPFDEKYSKVAVVPRLKPVPTVWPVCVNFLLALLAGLIYSASSPWHSVQEEFYQLLSVGKADEKHNATSADTTGWADSINGFLPLSSSGYLTLAGRVLGTWLAFSAFALFATNACFHLWNRRALIRAAARRPDAGGRRRGQQQPSSDATRLSAPGWWQRMFGEGSDRQAVHHSRLNNERMGPASPSRSLPSPPVSPGRSARRRLRAASPFSPDTSGSGSSSNNYYNSSDSSSTGESLRTPAGRLTASSPPVVAGSGASVFSSPVRHALTSPSTPTSWLTDQTAFVSDESQLSEQLREFYDDQGKMATLNYRELDHQQILQPQGGRVADTDWFDSFSPSSYRVCPVEKTKAQKRQPGNYDESYQEEARDTLFEFGLAKDLALFTERIRTWLSAYVLKPLVKKMDVIDANPVPVSTPQQQQQQQQQQSSSKFGFGGFSTGAKPSSFFSFNSPQTPSLTNQTNINTPSDPHERDRLYVARSLAVPDCDEKDYVKNRIRDLALGSYVSAFDWNGGGSYKGKPWTSTLPTDSALLIHLFCVFMDSHLPDNTNSNQPSTPQRQGATGGLASPATGGFGSTFGTGTTGRGGFAFGTPSSATPGFSSFGGGGSFGLASPAANQNSNKNNNQNSPSSFGNLFSQKYFCVFPHQPAKMRSDLILFFDYTSPPHFEVVMIAHVHVGGKEQRPLQSKGQTPPQQQQKYDNQLLLSSSGQVRQQQRFLKLPLHPHNVFHAILLFVRLCQKNKRGFLEGVSLKDPQINLLSVLN